jgi:polynucleotide 5'-kinase involved in rRNA processing
MRPAGRQHSVTIPITPVRTSSDSLRREATSQLARAASPPGEAAVEEVKLSPAGFETTHSVEVDQRTERQRHLAVAIRQRIESRLGGRVRDLAIRVRGATIVLEGRCSTFYTKQLAQHAALGVLEDEQLENAIIVMM